MSTTFFHSDPERSMVFMSKSDADWVPRGPDELHPGAPSWGVPTVATHTSVAPRMDRVLSRLASDYIVVQEWDDVAHAGIAGTPGVLRQLCERLGCSVAEAAAIVCNSSHPFTASEEKHAACVRYSDFAPGAYPMHHLRRSLAMALMFDMPVAMGVPLTTALGYEGSTARRMEPSLPIDQIPIPNTGPGIDFSQEVRSFVRHVDLAIRCALDSPQVISLTLKHGIYLEFHREKLHESVRGLTVSMSTGGKLFYRDLSAVPGTTNIVFKNRALPQRKVPFEIVDCIARSLMIDMHYHERIVENPGTRPHILDAAQQFIDAFKSSKRR